MGEVLLYIAAGLVAVKASVSVAFSDGNGWHPYRFLSLFFAGFLGRE
jgi:hypothetical protein